MGIRFEHPVRGLDLLGRRASPNAVVSTGAKGPQEADATSALDRASAVPLDHGSFAVDLVLHRNAGSEITLVAAPGAYAVMPNRQLKAAAASPLHAPPARFRDGDAVHPHG
jgi:hypothetical protein